MEAELFIQPPGAVPIPVLADADGQFYGVAGGISRFISALASVAGAYAAGQTMGGVITLAGAARAVGLGSGIVYGATIVDNNRNTGAVELLFFNSNPTNSTFTDKAEAVVSVNDAAKLVGSSIISAFSTFGAAAGCTVGNGVNFNHIYQLGKTGQNVNTSLFVVPVARAALTLTNPWLLSVKTMPD